MLATIGVSEAAELYDGIPAALKLGRPLNLPPALPSERDLRRHVQGLLNQNTHCGEVLSFLGGGVWQHDIPAVCDEINSRAEFLTAYGGDTYADLGKYQAIFEFQSMIGELVGFDMVSAPVYDWAGATTSALMMAGRITGRKRVLLAGSVSPEKVAHLANVAAAQLSATMVGIDPATGLMDLNQLDTLIGDEIAAVYIENPSSLGVIEEQAAAIAEIAHRHGALFVVGVDAISLGVLAPPAEYGADLVAGEAQGLGVHMQYSGGLVGFIASRDEPEILAEYPYLMVSIAPGTVDGELGFGWSTMGRTSYDKREHSRDYAGTTQWLWGITAAVYLSLLGPQGLREVGEGILQRSHYAMRALNAIPGVTAPRFRAGHFKEFVVDFNATGTSVAQINRALRERGIFGGHDLSRERPELGQSALYCVTEIHTQADLDRLAATLQEVLA
ncbi:MAG: aminomethyl-transferring glycine dehydrogenase subunit GcvPA [Thermomicrobiales bacterium]|nr:aminomethyl-transferring glycine dehydrogenase subunit GcvPA [Thermomicrobiales bacterium]